MPYIFMSRRVLFGAAVAAVSAIAMACSGANSPLAPGPGPGPDQVAHVTAVLAGAGDIAQCGNDNGRHVADTARLLERISPLDAVFTAGDNAYPSGSARDFAECYDVHWGRFKSKTFPSPGNHEYEGGSFGRPYFQYFGSRAGPAGLGFYSYNLGNWHIVSLNSMAQLDAGSEQYQWLQDDLAANRTPCSLAYWHHPRFTSGPSGGGGYRDLWRLLQGLGVDIVVNGHDHGYERFNLQNADGLPDPTGIREFVVGSGGASLYSFTGAIRNSGAHMSTYGVLRLTLRFDNYDYAFIEAGTGIVRDSDVGQACH